MNYLLDSNVCIALINGTSIKVRTRYEQAANHTANFMTSSIVVHELWYGVAKSERLQENAFRLTEFLARNLSVLAFTVEDARVAGEIRAELERKGKRIGEYDTLIAGQALSRNLVLVTANTKEFGRIQGLKFEDWTL